LWLRGRTAGNSFASSQKSAANACQSPVFPLDQLKAATFDDGFNLTDVVNKIGQA
jgi:hypothetical protein